MFLHTCKHVSSKTVRLRLSVRQFLEFIASSKYLMNAGISATPGKSTLDSGRCCCELKLGGLFT